MHDLHRVEVVDDGVARTIARARQHLLETRDNDGGWHGNIDLGPIALAMQLVVESHLGVLSRRDAEEGSRGLVALQQPDGSFLQYPHASRGSASATALAYAALVSCGRPGTTRR